jgi:hypothetical protein
VAGKHWSGKSCGGSSGRLALQRYQLWWFQWQVNVGAIPVGVVPVAG